MAEFIGPARRCICQIPKPERIDAHVIACSNCGGWFALTVDSADKLEQLRRAFPPAAAD